LLYLNVARVCCLTLFITKEQCKNKNHATNRYTTPRLC